jgi:transcriptional regulator with XRE-family HTH domain
MAGEGNSEEDAVRRRKMASVKISDELRLLMRIVRESPERWGCPHGLTQDEAAERCGISGSLYKNLELGGMTSTKTSTLVSICQALGIDPGILEHYGYQPVAEELRMRVAVGRTIFLDLDRLILLDSREQQILGRLLDKLALPVGKEVRKKIA